MLKGFWKLTWVETKIFAREPLGLIGSTAAPVILFIFLGRTLGAGPSRGASAAANAAAGAIPFNVAIFAALFIAIGAVLSLVAIIAIYREGGILKRLRATPLSPVTILGAHVVVKLGFAVVTLSLMTLADRKSVV
jgi:ABC-2 type transport system permease protein